MPKYRILSIDGGGLRELIAARILQRLNQTPGISGWLDLADLIAGTSTGGILALGIASEKSLEDICNLYIQKGPEIFDGSIWDDVLLLSVGTGVDLTYIKGENVDWGYAQWARPLISIILKGVMGISDYQAKELLGMHYHRLQVVFEHGEKMPMDAVKKIPRMDEVEGLMTLLQPGNGSSGIGLHSLEKRFIDLSSPCFC